MPEQHIDSSLGETDASNDIGGAKAYGLWRDDKDLCDSYQEKDNQITTGGKREEEGKVGGKGALPKHNNQEVEQMDNKWKKTPKQSCKQNMLEFTLGVAGVVHPGS